MKFSGFDGLVVRGRSEKPVYLWLHDGEYELRDATHLWGKPTHAVDETLKEELDDPKIEILQCGVAGEKGVRFAAIMNMSNRANGRTGMGAVMGSKNLKAVVVRGKQRPQVADKAALRDLAKWGAEHTPEDMAGMTLLGTTEAVRSQQYLGGLPTHNHNSGVFDDYKLITGRHMNEVILKENDTCYACAVRCKRVVESDGNYKLDPIYGGPEYETIATFGSYCGVSDIEAVAYANQLCNQYGMDTISCGATIAWAMECFENGIITSEDTGGIELKFGNAEAVTQMTEMIAKREGIGDILAEGSLRAAQHFGSEAEDLTVTVKGMEIPAHMPHTKRSLGLIYAVNPFGADHQSSEHDPGYTEDNARLAELGLVNPQPNTVLNYEKVKFALYTQWTYSCLDSVNLCQFVFGPDWQLFGVAQMTQMVRAVTGWPVTLFELQKLGERRLNMMRAFNAREGAGREADKLPKKFQKALVGGKSDGMKIPPEEIEEAKDIYYEMCGWDVATGTPRRVKLEELSIGWVMDELESSEPYRELMANPVTG